jgi:uncharacterized protein
MKIPTERLGESPESFGFEVDTAWWRANVPASTDLPERLDEPLHLGLEAYRVGDDVLLAGRLYGWLELQCGRCLARYRHRLDEPFRLVLEPAGNRVPTDPEGAEALARCGVCLGDELETGWYRGPEIELGELVRELVALGLPVQPVCREDCAGLCPRCGADWNQGRCTCPETKLESPFARLAALRPRRTEGDT